MKNLMYLFFAVFLFYACNEGASEQTTTDNTATTEQTQDQIPSDVISNPNTGDENAEPAPGNAKMEFEKNEHDFGIISQEKNVEYTFKFKNTGSEPLIISEAKGSCGCTVPSYPKEPVPVGGMGEITVSFDPKGKKGVQRKTVTITANTTPNRTTLNVVSDILAPDDQPN